MNKQKLLVFCIDALCSSDLPFMRELSHFRKVFENGAVVTHIEPAYPSMTYVCHTTILTGQNPARHGIFHNERVRRGGFLQEPWFALRSEIKTPTLLDYAKGQGLTTCSLGWPVSGGADCDYNMPMIVPYHYTGYQPEPYLDGTASATLMDRYFWKYGRFQKGQGRSLDLYTMALAPDIIHDYGQPDVMLVKMCDLDGARHEHGVYSEQAKEQLRKHNEEFGVLMESIRRYGEYDATNFVILGDHGQADVSDVLHMNVLLRRNGFLRLDTEGRIKSFDALCHSTGFSAFIELRDPQDQALYARVYAFLKTLGDDPRIRLEYVFTAEEALARYGLSGPFDFVIESSRAVSFSDRLDGDEVFGVIVSGDHKTGNGTHGGLTFKDETTAFVASGPAVRAGVVLDRRPMVNEAPTMAWMLGIKMPDTDGSVMKELIR